MTEKPDRWERTRARVHRIKEVKNRKTYVGWRVSWYEAKTPLQIMPASSH